MIYSFVRKTRSLYSRLAMFFSTFNSYAAAFGNPLINIDNNCQFGKSVKLIATDGGTITIGRDTCLADHVQIVVQGGRLIIENNVFIGTGSILVCIEDIYIGRDTLIAEYVVIRDQDHSLLSRPIKSSGFHTGAILIGEDCWLGAKATVLRGSTIGNGAVIGAHSLVRGNVPPSTLAVGCPAKIIRKLVTG